MLLPLSFYNRPTRQVAQDLLGCFLVSGKHDAKFMITETEAYCGPKDRASHASRGRTGRTEVMFGPPGRIYVYLIYGMYYMLNIVTEKKDYPAAVLLRGAIAHGDDNPLILDGPGKLTKYLSVDKSLNNKPVYHKKTGLWIQGRDGSLKPFKIERLPRVGVDYAGEYKDKLWRFRIKKKGQ